MGMVTVECPGLVLGDPSDGNGAELGRQIPVPRLTKLGGEMWLGQFFECGMRITEACLFVELAAILWVFGGGLWGDGLVVRAADVLLGGIACIVFRVAPLDAEVDGSPFW